MNASITACSFAGARQVAMEVFSDMQQTDLPKPDTVTWGAMMDALDRGEQWEAALTLLDDFCASQLRNGTVVWNTADHIMLLTSTHVSREEDTISVVDATSFAAYINWSLRAPSFDFWFPSFVSHLVKAYDPTFTPRNFHYLWRPRSGVKALLPIPTSAKIKWQAKYPWFYAAERAFTDSEYQCPTVYGSDNFGSSSRVPLPPACSVPTCKHGARLFVSRNNVAKISRRGCPHPYRSLDGLCFGGHERT